MNKPTKLQKFAHVCAIISTVVNIGNLSFQVTRYYQNSQLMSPPAVTCSAEVNNPN